MEAKELRIGNYVNIGLKSSDLITDYDAITASGLMDLQVNKERSSFIYEPISLTQEWLLKFGFVLDLDSHRTTYLSKHKITTYMQDGIFWCDILWDCLELKHVHQLQNLYFALTNEELKLT
jgi:hypothetical protein